MSPLDVFVAICIIGALVFTVGVTIMLAALLLTWLWNQPMKGKR